jgi:hypothetical protein
MILSIIVGVVFLPISVQSTPAWKSKWMPRKLSDRLRRRGVDACGGSLSARIAGISVRRSPVARRLLRERLISVLLSWA